MIIECPHCGAKNASDKPMQPGKRYRCGKCRAALFSRDNDIIYNATEVETTDNENGTTARDSTRSKANQTHIDNGDTSCPADDSRSTASPENSLSATQISSKTSLDRYLFDAFRPNGRFSRYQYAYFTIIIPLPVSIIIALLIDQLPFLVQLLFVPIPIILAIMATISAIRRLHDLGRRGWWCLLYLVPLVNIALIIYLILVPRKVEVNQRG